MKDNRDPQLLGLRLLAQLAVLRRHDPSATASLAADTLPDDDRQQAGDTDRNPERGAA